LKHWPIAGEAYRPLKILYSTAFSEAARPTLVVDITQHYEQRRRAILAYGSQFRPKKGERKGKVHLGLEELEDEMNRLARQYGHLIGVKYGEPFLSKELIKVDDVVEMAVRSI
jgi:LmbE family N-acetylglucosaminyl deacetylase